MSVWQGVPGKGMRWAGAVDDQPGDTKSLPGIALHSGHAVAALPLRSPRSEPFCQG